MHFYFYWFWVDIVAAVDVAVVFSHFSFIHFYPCLFVHETILNFIGYIVEIPYTLQAN